jgi:DNA-binding Lrp family transcriptional regulator
MEQMSKDAIARASDDYLRCVLAKSVAEVYSDITPKYRNEAARKQFFKRLIQITEATHLTQSASKLHEMLIPDIPDETLRAVNAEVNRHLVDKLDLSSEYASNVNFARQEFKSYLRQIENLVGISWEENEHHQKMLVLTSLFPPHIVEDENTWRWGSQWFPDSGILNINPPMLFFDVLRKGVLAREAAVLLSPRSLETMEYAPRVLCEQAEYLASKLFERKNDRELWSEARHGLRKQTRVFGHELIDFFHFYEMMVGDSLYQEVWSRLKEFGDIRLSVSDYYTIFNALASRPTNPRFNRQDKELLRLLSKRPDVKAGEAAKLLKVSVPTAMKAIRDLSRRAGLRFNVIVDMERLGLTENLILISAAKQADVIRVLSRFPYCRQVFRTYGSFDLFTVLDIPFEHSDFTQEFMQKMMDTGAITRYNILELQGDLQAVNFDYYDVERACWDVHWDTWGIGLRENLTKVSSHNLNYVKQIRYPPLDKLDLNILLNLQLDCRTPFSALGRSLNVSGAYIGKKVSKMLREMIFRYALWPLKIGAEDWGMIGLACSRPIASTLAQSLSLLPAWRGGLVTGDFEGIFAIVWCPNGEVRQFFKAIDDRLVRGGHAQPVCMNSVGEWAVARWLPVDPDESTPWHLFGDDGRWLFDKSRYMALVRQT